MQSEGRMSGISVRGLTKRYGDNIVVNNLSLDVADGELLVLLGPSGCGKTTTMRCIMGLEQAEEGSIRIGDKEVFNAATKLNVRPNRRDAGMVFQSYAIWPHMSVFENVAFPLQMQRISKAETRDRVGEVLDLVGLTGLGSRPASKLSGGQMQRVALARSVAANPSILCLDEPLSNLDAKLRDKLRFEIRQLQQKLKITMVYVTHDQSEAMVLADRLVVMKSGEIVQMAAPSVVYRNPKSTYVADFLGVTNIFSAEVERISDGCTSTVLSGYDIRLTSSSEPPKSKLVSVCIRPEAIQLSRTHSKGPNELRGHISVASFLGTQMRYQILLEDKLEVSATTSVADSPFVEGDEVFFSVDPQAVQLIVRDEG